MARKRLIVELEERKPHDHVADEEGVAFLLNELLHPDRIPDNRGAVQLGMVRGLAGLLEIKVRILTIEERKFFDRLPNGVVETRV